MRPDSFAATEITITVTLPSVFNRLTQPCRIFRREAYGQRIQELFKVALCGDRVDDGYHDDNYTAGRCQTAMIKPLEIASIGVNRKLGQQALQA